MSKTNNPLLLALKGIIIIYLPIILITFIIHKVVFGRDMSLYWDRILFYAIIIGILAIRNYTNRSLEIDIEDFESLREIILKGRWEIAGYNEVWLLVKPKFDFPFRMFFDDAVQVDYSRQRVTLAGAWRYVSNLERDIKGKSSFWTKKIMGISMIILIIFLVYT